MAGRLKCPPCSHALQIRSGVIAMRRKGEKSAWSWPTAIKPFSSKKASRTPDPPRLLPYSAGAAPDALLAARFDRLDFAAARKKCRHGFRQGITLLALGFYRRQLLFDGFGLDLAAAHGGLTLVLSNTGLIYIQRAIIRYREVVIHLVQLKIISFFTLELVVFYIIFKHGFPRLPAVLMCRLKNACDTQYSCSPCHRHPACRSDSGRAF